MLLKVECSCLVAWRLDILQPEIQGTLVGGSDKAHW